MAILAPAPFIAAPAPRTRPRRSGRVGLHLLLLGGAAALLGYQLRAVDFGALFAHVQPLWIAAAGVGFVISLAAAAHNISAFAPVRLRAVDTIKAQLAIGGLRVVAPSAVSTPAIGTRFLVRHGLPMPTAVTVVAVAQGAQLLMTVVVVAAIALIASAGLPGAGGTSMAIGAAAVAALVIVALVARRLPIVDRAVRPGIVAVRTIGAHLRDHPQRVVSGLVASGGLTLAHVAAFVCCVHAVGGHASLLALTAVYLGAASAGSLVPTPAGIGAVESAMISGLIASGLSPQVATGAALLSRLITVWLPAVPGLWALRSLRRAGLV